MMEGLRDPWLLCSGRMSGGDTSLTARSAVSPAGKSAEADGTAFAKSASWRQHTSAVKPTEHFSEWIGSAECGTGRVASKHWSRQLGGGFEKSQRQVWGVQEALVYRNTLLAGVCRSRASTSAVTDTVDCLN